MNSTTSSSEVVGSNIHELSNKARLPLYLLRQYRGYNMKPKLFWDRFWFYGFLMSTMDFTFMPLCTELTYDSKNGNPGQRNYRIIYLLVRVFSLFFFSCDKTVHCCSGAILGGISHWFKTRQSFELLANLKLTIFQPQVLFCPNKSYSQGSYLCPNSLKKFPKWLSWPRFTRVLVKSHGFSAIYTDSLPD